MSLKCERCPSCDILKRSAAVNPDGLCDECNGGIYAKKIKVKKKTIKEKYG